MLHIPQHAADFRLPLVVNPLSNYRFHLPIRFTLWRTVSLWYTTISRSILSSSIFLGKSGESVLLFPHVNLYTGLTPWPVRSLSDGSSNSVNIISSMLARLPFVLILYILSYALLYTGLRYQPVGDYPTGPPIPSTSFRRCEHVFFSCLSDKRCRLIRPQPLSRELNNSNMYLVLRPSLYWSTLQTSWR